MKQKKVQKKDVVSVPWFSVLVDGRCVGVLSRFAGKEKARLAGLIGIEIRPATDIKLMQFKAKTELPLKMVRTMAKYARKLRMAP